MSSEKNMTKKQIYVLQQMRLLQDKMQERIDNLEKAIKIMEEMLDIQKNLIVALAKYDKRVH